MRSILLATLLAVVPGLAAQQSQIFPDSMLIVVPTERLGLVGTRELRGAQKFIVPTVLLYLSVDGTHRVSDVMVRSTASATSEYQVLGVSRTFAQELAGYVQSDMSVKFASRGLKLQLFEDVKSNATIASARRLPIDTMYGTPIATMTGPRTTFAVVAPDDAQLFAGSELKKHLAFKELARETGAVVLVPEIWIQTPQISRVAVAQAGQIGVGISTSTSMDVRQATLTFITPSGATGSITHMVPIPEVGRGVGDLTRTGSSEMISGRALSAAQITALAGTGMIGLIQAKAVGANRSAVESYSLLISEGNYSEGVLRGAMSFLASAIAVIDRERRP